MIRGERIIQLNMALLIVIGALLLSLAQDDMSMLVITIIGVTFSLVFVDWLRWFAFHPLFVNALAFTVSFISFTQFAGGNTGTKLNAVASLLTYLQIVLLLQRKSPRLYWQIMMLSLLQVVVAAALNLDFNAGLVFFGYITLVVTGTIHLKIYRGGYELLENEKQNDQRLVELRTGGSSPQIPGVLNFRISEVDFRNQRKIAWQGLMLCLLSLLFSFTVFYSVPRFGSAWQGPGGSGRKQVGFTKQIRFDDAGFLHDSNRAVFRASFLDENDQPMELAIEPYFKGLLLKDFVPVNGQWIWSNVQNNNPGRLGQGAYLLSEPLSRKTSYVRQVIRLEPAGRVPLETEEQSHLVFSVFPVFQSEQTPADLVYNIAWDILFRDANLVSLPENAAYHYEVRTPLYRNLGQVPAVPVPMIYENVNSNRLLLKTELNRSLGMVCNRFDRDWKEITALASSIVEEAGENQTRRMLCNRFVNFLKRPDFKYTRDLGSIKRTPGTDPIVDFVLNHKSGHCEYFATALALMLRSQGIPCRIVTGYYGGDYNALGGFYLVKEKHAHVWVEAYLRPEDCDQDMRDTGQASELGAWLRLDPTPGSENSLEFTPPSLVDRAFEAVGFAQKIWDDYVTGLDEQSRVLNGFDPTDTESNLSSGFFSVANLFRERMLTFLKQITWWQWSLATLALVSLVMAGLYWRTRRKLLKNEQSGSPQNVWRELVHSSLHSARKLKSRILHPGRQEIPAVDFYEQFLRLAHSVGLVRKPTETPREFGIKVTRELVDQFPDHADQIQQTIQSITQAFYFCRFGRDADHQELQTATSEGIENLRLLLSNRNLSTG